MKKYVVRVSVGRFSLEVDRCDSLEEAEQLMKTAGKILDFVSGLPQSVGYSVEDSEV